MLLARGNVTSDVVNFKQTLWKILVELSNVVTNMCPGLAREGEAMDVIFGTPLGRSHC